MNEYDRQQFELMRERWLSGGKNYLTDEDRLYKGPFTQLDLKAQDWYCPQCGSNAKKLEVNAAGTSAWCNEHYMVCEYEYAKEEEFHKRGFILTAGFQLPITWADVLDLQIAEKESARKSHSAEIRRLTERRKVLKVEIAELKEQRASL